MSGISKLLTVYSLLHGRPLPEVASVPALSKDSAAWGVYTRRSCGCTSIPFRPFLARFHSFTVCKPNCCNSVSPTQSDADVTLVLI